MFFEIINGDVSLFFVIDIYPIVRPRIIHTIGSSFMYVGTINNKLFSGYSQLKVAPIVMAKIDRRIMGVEIFLDSFSIIIGE